MIHALVVALLFASAPVVYEIRFDNDDHREAEQSFCPYDGGPLRMEARP